MGTRAASTRRAKRSRYLATLSRDDAMELLMFLYRESEVRRLRAERQERTLN
jgi:hypothetical protein